MQLEDYQLGYVTDWAGFAFIRVLPNPAPKMSEDDETVTRDHIPLGYVFVIDPKFGSGAQYKLPSGHKKGVDATPLETAAREMLGETGIPVEPKFFRYAGKWLGWRKDHWRCLFVVDITEKDRDWMNDLDAENEGERPKYFTVEEFYECVRTGDFMRVHYNMLEEHMLVLPLGRDKVA